MMKIAVISFSGNVGKTTIARHLLAPRVAGAKLVSIESINAGEAVPEDVIRGRQFAALQEYLQVAENVLVDIGASNVEDLLMLMSRYRGSHQDFDYFIVPTVPATKQQRDTIATLVALARLGVQSEAVRLVFNMLDEDTDITREFKPLLSFMEKTSSARADPACRLNINEIYGLVNATGVEISALADDTTNFKTLIAATASSDERIALARRLAMQRLARGVVPALDACFNALAIGPGTAPQVAVTAA
jgi:MinD-like ATPase involved in chromosome partitioning or flagellar assembly